MSKMGRQAKLVNEYVFMYVCVCVCGVLYTWKPCFHCNSVEQPCEKNSHLSAMIT